MEMLQDAFRDKDIMKTSGLKNPLVLPFGAERVALNSKNKIRFVISVAQFSTAHSFVLEWLLLGVRVADS